MLAPAQNTETPAAMSADTSKTKAPAGEPGSGTHEDPSASTSWASSAPLSTASPTLRPRTVLALFGGLAVIVGAVIDWSRGGSANSFKVPIASLFDWKSQSHDPKLGYFLIAVGVVGMIVAFVRVNGFILVCCGALALGASVLYFVQMYRVGHAFGGSTSVTDLVGPGAWVLGVAGVVLLISPAVTPTADEASSHEGATQGGTEEGRYRT